MQEIKRVGFYRLFITNNVKNFYLNKGVFEMKKLFTFVTIFVAALFLYSCGGGGGSSATISLTSCNVSSKLISKSNPQNITFSWSVGSSSNTPYYMTVYLSKSGKIDSDSTLIFQKASSSLTDSITITPSSSAYKTLLDAYGGKYYLVFNASYDGSEEDSSTMSVSDFKIKNIWTVMVYMDGDNSLSSATAFDLSEMESIGSDSNVGIVVQLDTDSSTTKRLFAEQENISLLSDLGELNMGDYKTLEDFGKWAVDNYPADHYLLILWDHGMGFENIPSSTTTKDILWDNHPFLNYSMSIPDLSSALLYIKNYIGKKIDIVGMDACLMNMLEVAYEIRDEANYMVGSENVEPFDGWPYGNILSTLEQNAKTITPSDLSKIIVEDYINSYTQNDYPTQSSIALENIGNLAEAVNTLATDLINQIDSDTTGTTKDTLTGSIFDSVQRFDDNGDGILDTNDSYVDLYNLAQLIENNDNMTQTVKNAASGVIDAFNSCIVISEHKNTALENSHGLSIWFPNSSMYSLFYKHYDELEFAKDTQWDELLYKLVN